MENIKQLTINYLNKMNGGGYSQEQISEAMQSIMDAIPHCGALEESIFSIEQDMDANAFKLMMRNATKTKDESLDKNFEILFDIINSDGDGKLSKDELTAMFENDGDGTVTSWEVWSNLFGVENISDLEIQQGSVYGSDGTATPAQTTPAPSPTTPAPTQAASNTPTVNINECVEQLYRAMNGAGTDEDTLRSILDDPNISDDDFVEIVAAFEAKYGIDSAHKESLVTWIENDESLQSQTEFTSKLASRLLRAAENGNEQAIDVICKETYGGTAGQLGTADDFLAVIFNDNTSSKVISKISQRYSIVNSGRNLLKDIKNDYDGLFGIGGWFNDYGSIGNGIVAAINKASRISYS